MRTKNKSIKNVLAICLLMIILSATSLAASAGVKTGLLVNENFDKGTLSTDTWTKYGDTGNKIDQLQVDSVSAVFLKGKSDGTAAAITTKNKLNDI